MYAVSVRLNPLYKRRSREHDRFTVVINFPARDLEDG